MASNFWKKAEIMGCQIMPASPNHQLHERRPSTAGSATCCKSFSHSHSSCNTKLHCSCATPCSLSNSSNSLLSECSSLATRPSLARSLNSSCGSYADGYVENRTHGLDEKVLLSDFNGAVSARYVCVATLEDSGDRVACDGLSEDGLFYTASSGCQRPLLSAWRMDGGDGVRHINTPFQLKRAGAVRRIVLCNDRVFTSHDDLRIRAWAKQREAMADSSAACRVEHKLVAAMPTMWDCAVRAMAPGGYKQERRHHRRLWIQHADVISAMAVDTQEAYLYTGSWDRTVKVWRLRDFKWMESFRAHDDAVNAMALSTSGRFLYTAAADGKIKVWTWADDEYKRRRHGHLVATLQAHFSAVNALALSSDEEVLYSGACDKAIVVWVLQESAAEHAFAGGVLRGHRQAVLCLAGLASPLWGNVLCSGSADKSIRLWQQLPGRLHVCLAVIHGHSAPVKSLALACCQRASSPSSAHLALCSAALDSSVKFWQITVAFSR